MTDSRSKASGEASLSIQAAGAAKWPQRFLSMARLVASWSKDPSTSVGAVIADDRNRVVSVGYNGMPRGIEDRPDRLGDRPTKHALTVHAELNAILNSPLPVRGATLYCTHIPCSQCMAAVIQSGIAVVVVLAPNEDYLSRWGDSVRHSQEMAAEVGIPLLFATTDQDPSASA